MTNPIGCAFMLIGFLVYYPIKFLIDVFWLIGELTSKKEKGDGNNSDSSTKK